MTLRKYVWPCGRPPGRSAAAGDLRLASWGSHARTLPARGLLPPLRSRGGSCRTWPGYMGGRACDEALCGLVPSLFFLAPGAAGSRGDCAGAVLVYVAVTAHNWVRTANQRLRLILPEPDRRRPEIDQRWPRSLESVPESSKGANIACAFNTSSHTLDGRRFEIALASPLWRRRLQIVPSEPDLDEFGRNSREIQI